ncbi:hypothetical protein D3C71_1672460 [compost metagenome]
MVVAPLWASGSGMNSPASLRVSTPKAKPRSPAGSVMTVPAMLANALRVVVLPREISGGNR